MSTITTDRLDTVADLIGAVRDDAVRTDYSGRGMYGKTCLGFVLSGTREILALGAALAQVLDLEPADLPGANQDSMGWDTIIYFPGLTVEDES